MKNQLINSNKRTPFGVFFGQKTWCSSAQFAPLLGPLSVGKMTIQAADGECWSDTHQLSAISWGLDGSEFRLTHQLRLVGYLIINRVLYIQTVVFSPDFWLPSTVLQIFGDANPLSCNGYCQTSPQRIAMATPMAHEVSHFENYGRLFPRRIILGICCVTFRGSTVCEKESLKPLFEFVGLSPFPFR